MEGIRVIGYKCPHVLYDNGIHPVDAGELYVKVDEHGYAAKSEVSLMEKGFIEREHYKTYLPNEIIQRWKPVYRASVLSIELYSWQRRFYKRVDVAATAI